MVNAPNPKGPDASEKSVENVRTFLARLLGVLLIALLGTGCELQSSASTKEEHDSALLTGAGASFPAFVYQAWFKDYNRIQPDVRINYQAVGSGGGIQQFRDGTVDFAATDLPLTEAEIEKTPGAQHIPMLVGAIVITYNLPEVRQPLRLDGPALAGIWLGRITRWNDPVLGALNPGVPLPAADIGVISRADSSGTSGVFTDYLSSVSTDWKGAIGTAKAPRWPTGQGGNGNAGVANLVKQTVHSIAYLEFNYAVSNNLPFAQLQNGRGDFVEPTLETTAAAVVGVDLPPDYRTSVVNSAARDAYPIVSFTYLLLARDAENCSETKALIHMLWWALHDDSAAATARELHYVTLPDTLVPRVEKTLKEVSCHGVPLL